MMDHHAYDSTDGAHWDWDNPRWAAPVESDEEFVPQIWEVTDKGWTYWATTNMVGESLVRRMHEEVVSHSQARRPAIRCGKGFPFGAIIFMS